MYQLTETTSILRLADNALIPAEPSSIDYQEYLDWVSQGNEPLPYEPQPVVEPPNWPGFVIAIQNDTDFKTTWVKANMTDPFIAQSLLVSFSHITNGSTETFASFFNAVCELGGATIDQRNTWAGVAEAHHTPLDFIKIIRG